MAQNERFTVTYKQGVVNVYSIIVDNETGVNYLYIGSGYGGGLTPLMDAEGRVIVTPRRNADRNTPLR